MPATDSIFTLATLAVVLFASTNFDDLVLVIAFLANPRFRPGEVIAGQLGGIGALYAASVAASMVSVAVAPEHVAWLGLVPIALGVKELIEQVRGDDDDKSNASAVEDSSVSATDPATAPGTPSASAFAHAAARASGRSPGALGRVATVAGVTLANGADNLGVYIPVFAVRSFAEVAAIGAAFALMTVALCVGAHWLVNRSALSEQIRRYAGRSVPFVLIAIGVWILLEPRLG